MPIERPQPGLLRSDHSGFLEMWALFPPRAMADEGEGWCGEADARKA